MLSIAPPPTIYLHSGATDMRKSFDGLSGLMACLGEPDPGGMKVNAPAGEETFDDATTTETA